jgi:dihydroorotase
MSLHGMPLLIHGEVTSIDVDIFEKERTFIDVVLRVSRSLSNFTNVECSRLSKSFRI